MEFKVPDTYSYTESHEWIEQSNDIIRVGITDFAQDELGDIVFIDLPAEGTATEGGESFAVIESIKAVSDIYSPVSGVIADVNEAVEASPELVNEDPYGDGWLIAIEPDDEPDGDSLLTDKAYREQIR